jgi:hypothetical protein
MQFSFGEPVQLSALPVYEDALLSSLAFFRKQPRSVQALNCLTMYLRQSEIRVMSEIRFYAQMIDMEPHELLMLIHTQPEQAEMLLRDKLQGQLGDS